MSEVVRRRWAGLVVVGVGVLLTVASFVGWLSMPDDVGGRTWINGWGAVSGGAQIAGTNLNDAISGFGSFRPGMFALMAGTVAVVTGLVLVAVPGRGRHPHRISAALLTLLAVIALGWGIWRVVAPDSLGVTEPGEALAGLGPWLTMGGGLLLAAVAVAVFAGLVDPAPTLPRRGIQPR